MVLADKSIYFKWKRGRYEVRIVNLGDPFTRRITLRLTELQYRHICKMSLELGTSPSDYIRFLILQSAMQYDSEMMISKELGGTSDENVKTGRNNNI